MASTTCLFGQLLQAYLFFVGMTETQLAAAIGLSLNKVSAAIHGKYRLKRDHVDRILAELTKRGVRLSEEDLDAFLDAWFALRKTAAYWRSGWWPESDELPDAAAAAGRLAFAQALGRVDDCVLEQGCEPRMILAIAQGLDRPEQFHQFQGVERFAGQHVLPGAAKAARFWGSAA